MKIKKLSNRNIIFKKILTEWNLNLHLILEEKYNYIIDTGFSSQSVTPIKEYLRNNKNLIIKYPQSLGS